mgnify:CR=1 FL=1
MDYFKNLDNIKKSFYEYVSHLPSDGYLVINNDDDNSNHLKEHTKAKVITYGINNQADYMADNIKFNKEELLEAVERVSLLSPRDKEKDREITYSIIKLLLKNDQSVEISTENAQIGDAKEEIIPTGINSSETIRIGFSSRYLVEALRSFTSQEVTLNFSEAIRPFVISSEAEPNLCQLILPVRMD